MGGSRILNLYGVTERAAPDKSTGPRGLTTPRNGRFLFSIARRGRRKSEVRLRDEWTKATGAPFSTRTTNSRLVKGSYRARRPARSPLLTLRHREERLAWAARWINLTPSTTGANHVALTDESRYFLHMQD